MISSEIREAIYIAISAVLLAAVLGFVSFLLMVRGEFAEVYNAEIYSTTAMANYREFNKFNNNEVLFGEDIVAAIRDYYDTGIRIRVNNSDGTVYYVDKYEARKDSNLVEISNLHNWFPTTRRYTATLVYGSVDLDTVTPSFSLDGGVSTDVDAIVFFDAGPR